MKTGDERREKRTGQKREETTAEYINKFITNILRQMLNLNAILHVSATVCGHLQGVSTL